VDTSLITRDGRLRYACDPAIAIPLAAGSKNFTEVADVSLSPIWNEIQTPTLIIRGEKSDILSEETVRAMRATNLNAESITYPNVGHAPALMTDADTRPILNWLERTLNDLMAVSF
jgi:pimeloyl-ACP methyl ester carboxylesterase